MMTAGTTVNYEQPLGNAFCAMENTRLAIAETLYEETGLLKWIKLASPTPVIWLHIRKNMTN
jgi:hypothetical protein